MNTFAGPPMPRPTPTSQPFWDGVNAGEVRLQRCQDCQGWVFYPRSHCPHCLSNRLDWQTVSGAGTVYSFTIARRPTAPTFAGLEPQYVAVVELAEGVRMNTVLTNVEEHELRVGLAVTPVFERQYGDQVLLYFEPAASGA